MAIPEQTITGVSGLGATLLEFCGGQRRNSIPDQLRFSATADATPVWWLRRVVWGGLFFPPPILANRAAGHGCGADSCPRDACVPFGTGDPDRSVVLRVSSAPPLKSPAQPCFFTSGREKSDCEAVASEGGASIKRGGGGYGPQGWLPGDGVGGHGQSMTV